MARSAAVRPDQVRRHNLGLLLARIHQAGPLSRAELTTQLDLNRSTIGAFVSELCALGLLREEVPSSGSHAGRPSHMVGPRPDGPYAVAVDLEVDRLVIAAVGIGGAVLARRELRIRAPGRPDAVAGQIARAMPALAAKLPGCAWPIGVGVSVPGTVGRGNGEAAMVRFAPHLGWQDAPLGRLLGNQLAHAVPISLGNDADLAVIAEHLRGAAKDCDDVIYLAGKVGIGAGIMVDGHPLSGHGGLAGEVGHTPLDPNGPVCCCGSRGCVETFIGGSALLALAGHADQPAELPNVLRRARRGEPIATAAVTAVGTSLGRVLASLVNLLNPQRVILGGCLADVLELAGPQVSAALSQHAMPAAREMVELALPGLRADSSLLGAADLVFAPLLADPVGTVSRRIAAVS
jgi:predicted NBD/HSP70 family sugar kinase